MDETPCPWAPTPRLGLVFCSQEMSCYPASLLPKAAIEHLSWARHCARHWRFNDDRAFLSLNLLRKQTWQQLILRQGRK